MHCIYTTQTRTLAECHHKLLTMVSDAYLFHLVSLHRRPVYRHQYGDISLNQPALHGFVDSYLQDKGWDMTRRCEWYGKVVNIDEVSSKGNSAFIDWGTVPVLTSRGLRWMNACFSRLGEMVNEKGGWKEVVSES